jgi:hypothetical protein
MKDERNSRRIVSGKGERKRTFEDHCISLADWYSYYSKILYKFY